MKSGSDRYRLWCWVGFWHGWQKAGRSMFCMIPVGLCPSRNVGEGGKLSEKLLPAGPSFRGLTVTMPSELREGFTLGVS